MLEDQIITLAKARDKFEKVKFAYEKAQAIFEASPEYTEYKTAQSALGLLEDSVRDEALSVFNQTGEKHPHQAVEIKERTSLIVDEIRALAYAKTNLPDSLSINRKVFDKVMKALPEESLPDGVKIEKTSAVYISRDLSAYLEG